MEAFARKIETTSCYAGGFSFDLANYKQISLTNLASFAIMMLVPNE